MSILTRYLLGSFSPSFLMAVGVFLFVLFMNYFLRLFSLAVMKGISIVWIFACFARLLPYFLSLALPMAFLVALLLTLGQLSESGEAMALRSSGFSFREILTPYFALAVSLSVLLLYVNHKASPEGFHSFMKLHTRAVAQVSRVGLDPKTMTRMGDWEMYADGVDEDSGELSGIRLVRHHGKYKRLRVSAPRGTLRVEKERGVRLELFDGSLIWPNQDPQDHTASTFERYSLFMPLVDYRKVHRNPDLQELNTFRLRERLRDPQLELQKRREYETEAALRSAGALAPFVLFWVACPLGLSMEKRRKAVSFALSLLVMFLFYGLLALGIGLGRRSMALSPWGPWLPDAVCLAVGAALWRRRLKA